MLKNKYRFYYFIIQEIDRVTEENKKLLDRVQMLESKVFHTRTVNE